MTYGIVISYRLSIAYIIIYYTLYYSLYHCMLRVTETVRSLHFNSIRGADSFSDFEHTYIHYVQYNKMVSLDFGGDHSLLWR